MITINIKKSHNLFLEDIDSQISISAIRMTILMAIDLFD